jgi:hypothetical protein
MPTSPNLQVPQAAGKSGRGGGLSGTAFVLLLIVLVVQILSFFVSPKGEVRSRWTGHDEPLGVEQIRKAALELEDKNIPREAAAMWEKYLQHASLTAVEAGNVRYLIGKNLQNAGAFPDAFAQFVQAEMLVGQSNPELLQQISLARIDCLRRMGRYAELARELNRRATGGQTGEGLAGQQVVAEVGGQKLTVADFDRMLANAIELAVQSRLGISQEEAEALRRRAHEQFTEPQARAQQLQRLIAQQVLADEARQRGLHEQPAFRERLTAVADGILSDALLHEEIGKRATVTDADVHRYYEANKERYREPAGSFIAHILYKDEAAAGDALDRITGGESFEKIARAESQDAATRDQMGIIADPVLEGGEFVPRIGPHAELHKAIRAAEPNTVLPEPYPSGAGWHVVKVVSHRPKQDRPFEQVADAVRRDVSAARQRETTEQYLKELFAKHNVKLYPEVFGAAAPAGNDSPQPAATPAESPSP